jgi:hypothetical protein
MAKMPKRKRMAVGGKPGESAMARAEASRSTSSSSSPRDGGFAGAGAARSAGIGAGRAAVQEAQNLARTRNTTPVMFNERMTPGPMGKRKSGGNYPTVNRSGKGNPQGSVTGKDPARLKKGGMVKKKMKGK